MVNKQGIKIMEKPSNNSFEQAKEKGKSTAQFVVEDFNGQIQKNLGDSDLGLDVRVNDGTACNVYIKYEQNGNLQVSVMRDKDRNSVPQGYVMYENTFSIQSAVDEIKEFIRLILTGQEGLETFRKEYSYFATEE